MRGAVGAFLAVASFGAAAGCGDPAATRADPVDPTWAEEAHEVFETITTALDSQDQFRTAITFSAGGTLDMSHFGYGVGTSPSEVVDQLATLWFFNPGHAEVRLEHVFVSDDAAIVWWYAHERYDTRAINWAQAFVFGRNSRVASRSFGDSFFPYLYPGAEEQAVAELVDRYVAAWAGDVGFEGLYSADVVVRDALRGDVWRSLAEVERSAATAAPIEVGPFPNVFMYYAEGRSEAIVLVQVGGECPALEARRLVLGDGLVVHESRFLHIPSVRRCEAGLPDGWWSTFELITDPRDNVIEVVDMSGRSVELVHGEPVHEKYTRWLGDRFVAGGLGAPEIDSVWFPPSPDCLEQDGLAIEADRRYDDERAIVICFDELSVVSNISESGWSTPAIAIGLHELAHIWMRERIDDATRAAFTEMVGADAWRDRSHSRDTGVEHAAYTVAWGLAGAADARYPLFPAPACEELAARYRLLTGRAPVTECGPEGWSQ